MQDVSKTFDKADAYTWRTFSYPEGSGIERIGIVSDPFPECETQPDGEVTDRLTAACSLTQSLVHNRNGHNRMAMDVHQEGTDAHSQDIGRIRAKFRVVQIDDSDLFQIEVRGATPQEFASIAEIDVAQIIPAEGHERFIPTNEHNVRKELGGHLLVLERQSRLETPENNSSFVR